jgi:hypothetical protein
MGGRGGEAIIPRFGLHQLFRVRRSIHPARDRQRGWMYFPETNRQICKSFMVILHLFDTSKEFVRFLVVLSPGPDVPATPKQTDVCSSPAFRVFVFLVYLNPSLFLPKLQTRDFYPGIWFFSISDPGSNNNKRRGESGSCLRLLNLCINFTKILTLFKGTVQRDRSGRN